MTRCDSFGQNIAFQRYYPPMTSAHIFPEEDGTFSMIGMSVLSSASGPSDVMFVKLDSAGTALFYRKINAGYYDDAQYVRKEGSHFLVTGFYGAQYLDAGSMYVLELDSLGFVVNNGLYSADTNAALIEAGFNVCKNEYGGYSVLGSTWNIGAGMTDFYLVKTDSLGNSIWGKSYGGSSGEGGWIQPFERTSDNGYIFGSGTTSFDSSNYDMLIIKTDSAGNIQWQKLIGDSGYEEVQYIHQLPNGNYFLLGNSTTYDYWNGNMISVLLDSAGNIIESKTVGTKSSCRYVEQATNGDYLCTGSHNRKSALLVLDSTLELKRVIEFPTVLYLFNAKLCPDGGYATVGHSYNGQWQFFPAMHLIRTLPDGNSGCDQIDTIPTTALVPIQSNPSGATVMSSVVRKPVQFGTFAYNWPEFEICYCNTHAEFRDSIVGNSVYFFSESIGASTYEWHFGITAASSNATPIVNYYNPGTYYVTLIVRDGICSDTITHPVTIAAPPVPPVVHFEVYPSLAFGPITLDYFVDSLISPQFKLYDLTGRIVLEKSLFPGANVEIIASDALAQGTYYWQVLVGDDQRWQGKIMKVRTP